MATCTLLVACSGGESRTSPRNREVARAAERERVARRITFGAMGTEVVMEAQANAGSELDGARLDEALTAARVEFDRVEDMMTSWRDSPLVRMNDAADGSPIEVPEELASLVERALTIARLSGGAFDPTFASVGKAWDFKSDPPVIPSAKELEKLLDRVGWSKVTVDSISNTIAMPAGTRIGLGGIAKGYGVDRAMKTLMGFGVEHAIVNAGGDLKALGDDQGKAWEVAVKHPRDLKRAIAVVPVSNVCLVTSGDYERFFEADGVRYHHIIDPRTGQPATGCMSATVTAPDAALADGVATAVCVLGPDLGLEFVERLPKIEAIVVGMDGQVRTSSGLAESTTSH